MAFFVNKQLFWWSASITLDNNNDVSTDFWPFFSLYTLPHTSVGLACCIDNAFSVLNILTHLTNLLPVSSLNYVRNLADVHVFRLRPTSSQ